MMNTQPFDFGRLVDGLTIEIRINEDHRRALRFQMIERFETRQGQGGMHPTVKMAAVIVIGFGLVGIGLVVHQRVAPRPVSEVNVENALGRLEEAAVRGDLRTVTQYLNVQSLAVRLAVLRHLAVLGNAGTIEELEAYLRVEREPEAQSAAEQALEAIRQRLSIPAPSPAMDANRVVSPVETNEVSVGKPGPREKAAAVSLAFRLITSLRLDRPDYMAERWQGILDRFGDRQSGTHVFKVSRGYELAGQVLDRTGDPILGATVAEGYDLCFDDGPVWQTDGQGRFVMDRLQAGHKILTATAPGYAPEMKVMDVPSDGHGVTFSLEPGHVLRFEVSDSQGHPLRGARVETRAWRTFSPFRRTFNLKRQAQTNAKGAATVTDLPSDDVIFTVSKKGYAEVRHLQARPSDRKIKVTLHKPGERVGRIFNRETGAPVLQA